MGKKLPAIQFYPGDWRKDIGVQSMTLEEKGAWLEILLFMYDSEERGKLSLNGRPVSDHELASMLSIDVAKAQQIVSKLVSKGVANIDPDGFLVNRRMIRDDKRTKNRSQAGALGGKQKASNRLANGLANSTPSVSSSSSSSVSQLKTNSVLDFESLWASYPRQEGKKEAMKHLHASVTTPELYEACKRAIANYRTQIAKERIDFKFVKHGSTFFNNWKDYENSGGHYHERRDDRPVGWHDIPFDYTGENKRY